MREIPIKQAKVLLKRSLKGKPDQQVKLLKKEGSFPNTSNAE